MNRKQQIIRGNKYYEAVFHLYEVFCTLLNLKLKNWTIDLRNGTFISVWNKGGYKYMVIV